MIFRNWILENFPFLEDDFDALTDYELFCKMMEYVKQFAKDNEDFNKRLTALENYINNLDLQDEVDKKLDEMAESGELAEIVSQYLQLATTFTYKTVDDMKASENLINGSFARTKGFYTFNDGGGANYYIRNITNEDVIDNIHLFAITYDVNLVAELIENNKINILQLGCVNNDNTVDNSNNINYALANYKKVYIPTGIFYVNNDLTIGLSDIEIYGDGKDSIIHASNRDTGNLFVCSNKHNINLHDFMVENDNSRTDNIIPNYLMGDFNNSYNIIFNNFYANNFYGKGFEFINSYNITITNSTFTNATYSMIAILTECHDILVDNCIFDTSTTTYASSYLFSTGAYDYATNVSYLCKNVTIRNSKFLNNPNWEGIDSHGCENLTIENNVVYNCKAGIVYQYDERKNVTNYAIDNISIINNTITAPDNIMVQGISVSGSADIYCKNVVVKNNKVVNCNATNATAIYLYYIKYFECDNNYVYNLLSKGINCLYCIKGLMNNNKVIHADGRVDYGMRAINSYFIHFSNNYINQDTQDDTTKYITYGIGSGGSVCGLATLDNNICINKNTSYRYYFADNTIINPTSATNTRRMGMQGIKCVDQNDIIKGYYTDPVLRSVSATISATITASVNDTILDFGETNIIAQLAPLQEIIIVGAGENGGNLTTQIIEYISPRKFKIKDPILTAVTNANIQTTSATLVIL